jgi:hypothetical protein
MDIIPIILPIVSNYIIGTYCPLTPNFNPESRIESRGDKIYRENVWPILSGTIGFAWYFARNKAIDVQAANLTTKGTRATVSKLSKYFEGSHRYVVDFAFLVLIFMTNWWIYLYYCRQNYNNAFHVLLGAIISVFVVCYLTSSYTSNSMLILTPLLLWLILTAHTTGMQYYANKKIMENPDTDVLINDVEKANEQLTEEDKDIKEEFRIW